MDEVAASDGDARYALGDGYFIVDGYAFTASHDRSMYLFAYGKDCTRLLDMIGDDFVAKRGFEFVSNYPGKPAYGEEITEGYQHTPVWVIKEKDGRGNPPIRIRLYHDPFSNDLYDFYANKGLDPEKFEELHLYVKVETPEGGGRVLAKAGHGKRAAHLRVAIDPEIYRPLFDGVREVRQAGVRPAGYYVYGFLSGQLDLPRIKAELADNKLRHYVVDFLEDVGNWDAAAHDRSEEQPVPEVVEYKLKER